MTREVLASVATLGLKNKLHRLQVPRLIRELVMVRTLVSRLAAYTVPGSSEFTYWHAWALGPRPFRLAGILWCVLVCSLAGEKRVSCAGHPWRGEWGNEQVGPHCRLHGISGTFSGKWWLAVAACAGGLGIFVCRYTLEG